MAEVIGFRCRNCQNEFVAEILSDGEKQERRRSNEPMGRVICPRCRSEQVDRV